MELKGNISTLQTDLKTFFWTPCRRVLENWCNGKWSIAIYRLWWPIIVGLDFRFLFIQTNSVRPPGSFELLYHSHERSTYSFLFYDSFAIFTFPCLVLLSWWIMVFIFCLLPWYSTDEMDECVFSILELHCIPVKTLPPNAILYSTTVLSVRECGRCYNFQRCWNSANLLTDRRPFHGFLKLHSVCRSQLSFSGSSPEL